MRVVPGISETMLVICSGGEAGDQHDPEHDHEPEHSRWCRAPTLQKSIRMMRSAVERVEPDRRDERELAEPMIGFL